MSELTKADILRLFNLLNQELAKEAVQGELYLVGGAVMCLVFDARPSTQDIDGFFRPATQCRNAAEKVARLNHLESDWLNDAVKGFLSNKGTFNPYLSLSHLQIYQPSPEYLLAMKCLAMRIGEE